MSSSKYPSSSEITNAIRASRVLLGPCTDQLRDILRSRVPLSRFGHTIRQTKHLFARVLSSEQFNLIIPQQGDYGGNYDDMDISLLYILLRNIGNIRPHSKGWGTEPYVYDNSLSANIERVRLMRNRIAHSYRTGISQTEFNIFWSNIRKIVLELDSYLNNGDIYTREVDILRTETLDPERDYHYQEELRKQAIDQSIIATTQNQVQNLQERIETVERNQEELRQQAIDHSTIQTTQYNVHKLKDRILTAIDPSTVGTTQKQAEILYSRLDSVERNQEELSQQAIGQTFIDETKNQVYRLPGEMEAVEREITPWNPGPIRRRMEIEINEWKEVDDKFYQETHSFPLMMEKVRKQCYVTFVGVPGSGKTTTSRHIALKLQRAGYEIVPLIDVKKLEEYSNSNFPQVFVLDDVVGKFGLDKTNYRPLERPDLQKFITEPRMRETKILMTSRHTIFKKLFSRNSFLTKDENVINLCDREHRLNGNDKQAILEAYGIDIQCLSVRLPKPFSAMFPLLCFLLSKKKKDQEDSSYNASDFLVSPFDGILEELQKMSKIHYASLVLCMMSWNHCLSESTLSSETFRKIKSDVLRSCKVDSFTDAWRFMDSLSEMEGTYTRRRSDDYTFIHDSMFEIVAYHYGRKHPEQILKYMSLNYIENYVKLEDSSSEISYTRQKFLPGMNKLIADEFSDLCLIMLEKEHYPFLAERIFFELKEKSIQFSDCITSTLKHPTFKHFFLRLLQRLSLDELETIFLSRQYVRIKSWRLRGVHYSLLKNEERGEHLTDISQICTTNAWLLYDGHIDMLQCILEKYKKESIDATKLLNKMTNIQSRRNKRKLHGDETINDDKKINEDKEQARLLMLGCCSENIQLVKLLISHLGPTAINTECVYGRPMTPLSFACKSSNIRVVEELIKNGADVNQRLNQRYMYKGTGIHLCLVVNALFFRKAYFEEHRAHTPLTAACTADNTDIIDMLLERGASINLNDVFLGEDSQTPLSTACMYGNLNVMVKLLEKGANIDLSDGTGNTPLTTAIMSGNIQLVDKLLRLGASINQQDGNGFTPLSCVCGSRDEKIGSIPFEFYRSYNDIQRNNLSNQKGQMELIELLVQSGANVNDLDGLGDTPLTAACKSRKADVVRRLLRFSVDVNKEDASGNAPIHIACKDECWNIVDVLLQEGASINQRDTHGNTSLIRACTSMRTGLDTVRKLVELNADVNLPDREGRTPLVILCQKENLNGIVDLLCVDLKDHPPLTFVFKNGLLDWTTAFKQRDDNWKTAISFIKLVQEKPQYGSIINIRDKLGKTALTMACRIGDLNLVAAIIAAGADLNLSNGCGLTPLNIAHMHSHLPIVELLVEQGAECKMDGYLFYKEILLAVLNKKSDEKNRIVRINNRFEPYRGNWLLFHSLVYLRCNFLRIEGIDDKTFQGELWKAVSRSDCCLLKYLISIGFDIEKDIRRYDQAQQDTVTEPLFHALINENDPEYGVKYRIDKIGFLLESGINSNRRKVYEVDIISVVLIGSAIPRCSAFIKKKIDKFTGDMSVLTRTNHLKELYSKSVHPSDKELAKEYNTCLLEIKKYARRHSI